VTAPFLTILFVLISLMSGFILVRQYRTATPKQRRQIVFASGTAVVFAVILLLVFKSR